MTNFQRIRSALTISIILSFVSGVLSLQAEETPAQHDARMKWWREARFGMFVHWGIYSGLAGSWKGKKVEKRGGMERIQGRINLDTWEYAHEAAPKFRPSKDFAEKWAKLAKEAGCKYVVFTTKHHDGFALFDSEYTTYDAKDWTGRDLCKEIVDALRKEKLKVGFYHSVIDWHHPQYDYQLANNLPYPLKGKPSPNGPRNMDIYIKYLHNQVRELMSNYGKVDIIWWDFSRSGNEGEFWHAKELLKMVRKLQPQIISNNRLYKKSSQGEGDQKMNLEHGDFSTPEQKIPSTGLKGVDWETCMTMNGTWGYSKYDHNWKTSEKLIQNLVDIASKGGNYLLNIGPKGDGSIPEESIKIMHDIGKWMKVNGEAIYATHASPFKAPKWGRYTSKPGILYIHIFDWPEDGKLEIPVKSADIAEVNLLGNSKQDALKFVSSGNGTVISLPEKSGKLPVYVLKLQYKTKK